MNKHSLHILNGVTDLEDEEPYPLPSLTPPAHLKGCIFAALRALDALMSDSRPVLAEQPLGMWPLMLELTESLTSSLDMKEVLARIYEVLSKVIVADYAAICLTRPSKASKYYWWVAGISSEHFARYHELAAEDFMRNVLVLRPHSVLRNMKTDTHDELERMAVSLDVGQDWHGAFMLHRNQHLPFSEKEQAHLQRIAPLLANTVHNCRVMGEMRGKSSLWEHLSKLQGVEIIVLAPSAKEWTRSAGASALLEAWFSPRERGTHGLPMELLERLTLLRGLERGGTHEQRTWKRMMENRSLRIDFVPLAGPGGNPAWGLLMEEIKHGVPVPSEWREHLTPREAEVMEHALRYLDNQDIAEELGCTVATVKKHLQHAFEKLGLENRSMLLYRATRHGLRK